MTCFVNVVDDVLHSLSDNYYDEADGREFRRRSSLDWSSLLLLCSDVISIAKTGTNVYKIIIRINTNVHLMLVS